VVTVPLSWASAAEVVKLVTELNKDTSNNQFDHLRGGGPGERHGHHAAIPGVVDAFDNSQQAFDELNKDTSKSALPGSMVANVVADERTNSVLVSGDGDNALARVWLAAHQHRVGTLIGHHVRHHRSRQQAVQGNTKVIYLKYAKAADLVEVLTGISSSLQRSGRGL
jgi:hypothetical protein